MIPGSDWSMGLNSPTSVSQATVLASLGGKLRNLYTDLIAEGVPEHLAEIVSRLEPGKPASANWRGRDQSRVASAGQREVDQPLLQRRVRPLPKL